MRFPVFALIAPIVTSLVLYLVTKSPYTLLFALMGPVMAVASYGDGRLGERRRSKAAAHEAATAEVDKASARQQEEDQNRSDLRRAHPAPGHLSAVDPRARPPWNPDLAVAGTVRLGLTRATESRQGRNGVPLLVPSDAGIVAVGNPVFSLALARALWMQLAWNVAPETLARHPVGWDRSVLAHGQAWPLRLVESEAEIPPAARFVVEILSPNEGRLSDRDNPRAGATLFIPDYITAVEASAFARRLETTSRQIEQARPGAKLPTQCDLAEVMTEPPTLGGDDGGANSLARSLGNSAESIARTTLLTNVGVSSAGILGLDLVAHGPHAVVTGMTGSGKTEFLLSWLLSAALRYSPQEFTMLIIDFKGGSGFARVAGLPHCLGVMTDLDVIAAQRALHSLGAELRFREHTLNKAGVTDFAALPESISLARLAIVVDEYRALLDRFPELQPLFLDIAARGRALGIHLILGTQRATGVLADGILANCALRVVFRVNNVNDSMALLETDAARTLPEIPGRAALLGTSLALTHVQIARASSADAHFVAEHAARWLDAHPRHSPRRPWLPPLPLSISLAELEKLEELEVLDALPTPASPSSTHPSLFNATSLNPTSLNPTWSTSRSFVLGLLDEPENQRQSVAHFVPARDGHLLVTGTQGSGRSSVLRLFATQASDALSLGARDAEGAWDAITSPDPDVALILVDDIEALLAQFTLEHRDAFLEALMALLRTGPSRGTFVVIASQNGPLFAAPWAALLKSTLALGRTPGRGLWNENALQGALVKSAPVADQSPAERSPIQWNPGQQYVVVTPRPRLCLVELATSVRVAASCPASGPASEPAVDLASDLASDRVSDPANPDVQFTDVGRRESGALEVFDAATAQVFIGDVEDWQAQYALLAQLRARATFVFDECSPAEVRAIRRSRHVLPHARRGTALCVSPEGVIARVSLS